MSNIALSPEEFKTKYAEKFIPYCIIDIVNERLIKNYKGDKEIILKQNEIIDDICCKLHDTIIEGSTPFNRNLIFQKGWLNFEDLYSKKGWKIIYEKPAFDEHFEPYWKFIMP